MLVSANTLSPHNPDCRGMAHPPANITIWLQNGTPKALFRCISIRVLTRLVHFLFLSEHSNYITY